MFAGFETSFTTFAVLFLALWKLVWIDRMYRCQDTFLNVHSQALKQVLQHLKFYFESIGGIVAKIREKRCICWLWNLFFGIRRSILSTLEVILSQSNVSFPRYWRKCSFASFEIALEVILRQSDVYLRIYGQKLLFSGFETGFTVFIVLYFAIWRIFWVNRRYHSEDKCVKVNLLSMKPVLQHSLFSFYHLKIYFQ